MILPRTNLIIEEVEAAIAAGGLRDTPIESYLTQFVFVVMYAELETTINSVLVGSSGRVANPARRQYYSNNFIKSYRGVKKGDLADFLKGLCDVARAHLDGVDSRTITHYGNLIANRHAVAHGDGVQATFGEVARAYEAAVAVVNEFERALEIAYDELER